jgi:drug/metabolite transporter (DMT)-like permease
MRIRFAALALAAACWGTSATATKSALSGFGPILQLLIELLIAAAALQVVHVVAPGKASQTPLRAYMFLALLDPAIPFLLILVGLTSSTATNAALLVSLESVTAIFFAAVIGGEPISRSVVVGGIVAVIGALLVSSPGSGGFRFGDLLFLAATIPLGLSVTVVRRIAPTTPSLEMARYQMICAAAMVAPCALVGVLVLGETAPGLSDPGAWGPAVYAGLVGLALSNVSFNYAMGRISAVVAGIALNLVPVVGFISATLLLGEEMSVVQLIGALLIVVGLGISAFSTRAIEASPPLSIEGYLHGNRPVDSRE